MEEHYTIVTSTNLSLLHFNAMTLEKHPHGFYSSELKSEVMNIVCDFCID